MSRLSICFTIDELNNKKSHVNIQINYKIILFDWISFYSLEILRFQIFKYLDSLIFDLLDFKIFRSRDKFDIF